MADAKRLAALSMPTELAKEVAKQIDDAGGGGSVAWGDVTGKPAVIAAGADAAAARAAIGAGTPYTLPAAGTSIGGVKKGVAVPDAVADGELATLNALLASLRTAGVIA